MISSHDTDQDLAKSKVKLDRVHTVVATEQHLNVELRRVFGRDQIKQTAK